MKRFLVETLILAAALLLTACSEDTFDNLSRGEGKIGASTTLTESVDVVGETRAGTQAQTRTMKGSRGKMFLRFTAAQGIHATDWQRVKDGEGLPVTGAKGGTRGRPVTTDNFHDDYRLFLYKYPRSAKFDAVAAATMPWIVDEQVQRDRSWMTSEYWPGGGSHLTFICYAPYDAAGITGQPTLSTKGFPVIHYTVPTDATKQSDLLVDTTKDVPGDYNQIKQLHFKHACTAVQFAVGEKMAPCNVTSIAIKGVYGEGDFDYSTMQWSNLSSTKDFSLSASLPVRATDHNKVINSGDYTFMMLPQTLPDDAQVEITVNDGAEHKLTCDIGGQVWKPGYTVTYYLSTSRTDDDYFLSVTPSASTVARKGGTVSFSVKSYRMTFYGSEVAVPWTGSYTSTDEFDGTSGTTSLGSGVGTASGETNTLSFTASSTLPRSRSWRNSHTMTLQNASDASCNLIKRDGQSANCYVISAPGTYTFPLVYGNALNYANGSYVDNSTSYSSSTFVDYEGNHITSPYIATADGGKHEPDNACIVWQDAPGLVDPSSLKLVTADGKKSLQFTVDKKHICPGNSVLAVRNKNGQILWSWHIWVTDHDVSTKNTIDITNRPTTGGSITSKFMEVPLGWCDAETRVYNERSFTFNFRQSSAESSVTAACTVLQNSGDSTYVYGDNAPYYQFGRKDPMLPSNGATNNSASDAGIDKPYYDYNYLWSINNSQVSTATGIQNPFTFYYAVNDDWSTSHNYDYWNINFTSAAGVNNTAVVKTIYDPAPAGFHEPCTAAFTSFTTTGGNTVSSGQFNVSGSFNQGWNFYNVSRTKTIFFKALGCRSSYSGDANGVAIWTNVRGYYWSAGASSAVDARFLSFGSGYVYPQCEGCRAYGFTCRPVSE
ncbi:fimbrillin family protein [Prevotella sp. AGR2160]|uniref:fimbrillin family protein n=1 Tax=Prevotella sp. AGR2160 TaxID=1280674 RepID=UPI0003F674C0|nr:fimbrillin family protein [Prevotella sp. AGR2160]